MKIRKTPVLGSLLLCLCLGNPLRAVAEDMRILVPYVGTLSDVYEDSSSGTKLEDSGLLLGLYFQWINPEHYQWNVFLYGAPDVNYSRVVGGHAIFDWYPASDRLGQWVLGSGLECMDMEMDAGNSIAGTRDFTLSNLVLVPYLRAGKYFKAALGPAAFSLLPWAGGELEVVRGNIDMEVNMGPMPGYQPVSEDISEDYLYAIAGLNLKMTLFHILEVEGKYQIAFDESDYYNTWSGTANLYFSHHWGLSYRFKSMERDGGSDVFHYVGLAWLF